jgi:hypothetical protein
MNVGSADHPHLQQGRGRPKPHLAVRLHRQPLRVPRGRLQPVGRRAADRDEHHAGRLAELDRGQARGRDSAAAWNCTATSSSAATATPPSGTMRSRSAVCATSRPPPTHCPALLDESVIALFERTGVLSPVELESRYEVYAEQYILSIGVEAKTDRRDRQDDGVPRSDVVPVRSGRRDRRCAVARRRVRDRPVKTIADEANALIAAVAELESALASTTSPRPRSTCSTAPTRSGPHGRGAQPCGHPRGRGADEYWPLPKYREMLFIK